MVRVLPVMDAGPETTLKVTAKPELAVADSAIGETPYVTGAASEAKLMVCFDALTVTLTEPVTVLQFAEFAGMKVTLCNDVPRAGAIVGVVNTKLPATEAAPPLNVEEASDCPAAILLAEGHAVTVGVALSTVTATAP
jgi:hypothetical protein